MAEDEVIKEREKAEIYRDLLDTMGVALDAEGKITF